MCIVRQKREREGEACMPVKLELCTILTMLMVTTCQKPHKDPVSGSVTQGHQDKWTD